MEIKLFMLKDNKKAIRKCGLLKGNQHLWYINLFIKEKIFYYLPISIQIRPPEPILSMLKLDGIIMILMILYYLVMDQDPPLLKKSLNKNCNFFP
jgi:hypothetical protein